MGASNVYQIGQAPSPPRPGMIEDGPPPIDETFGLWLWRRLPPAGRTLAELDDISDIPFTGRVTLAPSASAGGPSLSSELMGPRRNSVSRMIPAPDLIERCPCGAN